MNPMTALLAYGLAIVIVGAIRFWVERKRE